MDEGSGVARKQRGIVPVLHGVRMASFWLWMGTYSNSDQRHTELQRLRYFTERLATDIQVSRDTPFVILVSKADEIGMQMPVCAEQLRDYIRNLGFPAETILSAAFSRKPAEIENGMGVFNAIEAILSHTAPRNNESSVVDEEPWLTREHFNGSKDDREKL